MLNLQDFLHATPAAQLEAYFGSIGAALPCFDWHQPTPALSQALLKVIDSLVEPQRQQIMDDADRICVMAREDGQEALFNAIRDTAGLKAMENGHARATWVFVHDQKGWETAEQTRYADDKRFGRSWDGFAGPCGKIVDRSGAQTFAFRDAVAAELGSSRAEVEVCDRSRAEAGIRRAKLVQVAIFLEGRRGDRRAFIDGQLGRVPDRPVLEAAICYQPTTGAIEVVAGTRQWREALVRLFAEHMLGGAIAGERLPLREYRIDRLRQHIEFPTEVGDGIESIVVTQLRLMPLDAPAERVTLECGRGATRSIWTMAEERFGEGNPLRGGYRVTQARLRIRFAPVAGKRGPRTLPVTITMPHGCDLKGRTARERLIGEKYLALWNLRADV